jgi:hypothetical protein
MNSVKDLFTEADAVTLWDSYCDQVLKASRPLNEHDRQALLLEIKDHVYTSFQHQQGPRETARLTAAIEKIGDPGEFVRPMMTDLLIADAARTMNPRSVISGLYFNFSPGIKAFISSLLFGTGYLLSLGFLMVAIIKPFTPERVGLFAYAKGGYTLGILDTIPAGTTELLGYWVIPLALALSIGLYVLLTKGLGMLRANRKKSKLG